jgi:peptidyl-prolyl cis-trans isomerase A (cyclophilin A)
MARFAPGTATSEFFICVGNLSGLDANPKATGDDAAGYAVFGRVVAGLDVVKAILNSPISATKGEDIGLKGQLLDPEVPITTAKRA